MRDTMLGGFLAMEREHDRLIAAGAPLNFEPGDMESEYLWNAFASPPRSLAEALEMLALLARV
jgi:hypothetical protein